MGQIEGCFTCHGSHGAHSGHRVDVAAVDAEPGVGGGRRRGVNVGRRSRVGSVVNGQWRRRRFARRRVGQRPDFGLHLLGHAAGADTGAVVVMVVMLVMQFGAHRWRPGDLAVAVEVGHGHGHGDAVGAAVVDLSARAAAHRRVRRHGTARRVVAVALVLHAVTCNGAIFKNQLQFPHFDI